MYNGIQRIEQLLWEADIIPKFQCLMGCYCLEYIQFERENCELKKKKNYYVTKHSYVG